MRTIGLLGGMSWQSTVSYYRYLNEGVGARLGGRHSADIRLWSGDFDSLARASEERDWDLTSRVLCEAGRQMVMSGADLLVIAANTAHVVADQVEAEAGVPLVNVIDATARRLQEAGVTRAALLGTAAVMEGGFYVDRMADNGVVCDVPGEKRRHEIDRIIFEELVHGVVDDGSHRTLVDTIDVMADRGAEGVILGCTELGLILDEDDGRVPGFDTTRIHCEAAVEAALD